MLPIAQKIRPKANFLLVGEDSTRGILADFDSLYIGHLFTRVVTSHGDV